MNKADAQNVMKRCIEELRGKHPPELVDLAVINVRMVKMYDTLLLAGLRSLAEEQNDILTVALNMMSSLMNFTPEKASEYNAIRDVLIKRSGELAKEVEDD